MSTASPITPARVRQLAPLFRGDGSEPTSRTAVDGSTGSSTHGGGDADPASPFSPSHSVRERVRDERDSDDEQRDDRTQNSASDARTHSPEDTDTAALSNVPAPVYRGRGGDLPSSRTASSSAGAAESLTCGTSVSALRRARAAVVLSSQAASVHSARAWRGRRQGGRRAAATVNHVQRVSPISSPVSRHQQSSKRVVHTRHASMQDDDDDDGAQLRQPKDHSAAGAAAQPTTAARSARVAPEERRRR